MEHLIEKIDHTIWAEQWREAMATIDQNAV